MEHIVNNSRLVRTRVLASGLTCLLITAAALACGKGGKGGGGGGKPSPGETPPPDEENPDLGLTTDVQVRGLSYNLPFLASCMRSLKEPSLPEASGLVVDGDFSDWPGAAVSLLDPIGDAPPGLDLGGLRLARKGSGLAIGLPVQPEPGVALEIELGGALVTGGDWRTEVRALFRIEEGRLYKWRSGSFALLDPSSGTVSAGGDGVEILIENEALGDAGTWPSWWIRAMSHPATGPGGGDATAALYLPTLLGTDHSPVVFGGCLKWSGQAKPITFQYLRDSGAAVPDGFPIDLVAERAFQIVRLAFDATTRALRAPDLPISQIPLLITSHDIGETTRDPRPLPGAPLLRGLKLDVSHLGPASTDPYPQGPIFDAAVSYFLELYLQSRYPEAPDYLRESFQTAMRDVVIQQELGLSFWLDRYREGILPFLQADDTAEPLPLPERSARLRGGGPFPADENDFAKETGAKAVAFGHMLGRFLDVASLVNVWNAMAESAPDGLGDEKKVLTVFLEASLEALASHPPPVHEDFRALWPGWLEPAPYDQEHLPLLSWDGDLDGLPGWFEIARGTTPDKADSDGDGWTDMAEILLESDPLAATRRPEALTPDGDFNDWLELLPRKVTVDVGSQGSCPKAADITHYSAVANSDELVIGAYAQDFFENEPKARWEALIELQEEERRLLITATSGAFHYEVRDAASRDVIHVHRRAVPMGRGVVEWTLSRRILGLKNPLNQPGDLKIRLRSVFDDKDGTRFCDETAWFKPFVHQ